MIGDDPLLFRTSARVRKRGSVIHVRESGGRDRLGGETSDIHWAPELDPSLDSYSMIKLA